MFTLLQRVATATLHDGAMVYCIVSDLISVSSINTVCGAAINQSPFTVDLKWLLYICTCSFGLLFILEHHISPLCTHIKWDSYIIYILVLCIQVSASGLVLQCWLCVLQLVSEEAYLCLLDHINIICNFKVVVKLASYSAVD